MMRHSIFSLAALLFVACSAPKEPDTPTMTPKEAAELKAIDETISKVFAAICFETGQPPNMYKLKELFVEGGLLINYNEEAPLILPVDQFVEHFEKVVADGIIPGLEDREVHQKTEIFDRVAHRFSFYEARFKPEDPEPFARGVNSLQLIKTTEGWRVTSMAWNDDNRNDGFFDRVMTDK